jgi:hypothetical protein
MELRLITTDSVLLWPPFVQRDRSGIYIRFVAYQQKAVAGDRHPFRLPVVARERL